MDWLRVFCNRPAGIGISPFLSTRTSGEDSLEKTEYGGLVQLRIGTEAYEY